MERNNNCGSRVMPKPYSYVARNSAKIQCIRYKKGKSSLLIHERHGNLKYRYGNRSFWCRGYYVDTTGKSTQRIAKYIQNQLKEDQISDQITMKEYEDPFTGGK